MASWRGIERGFEEFMAACCHAFQVFKTPLCHVALVKVAETMLFRLAVSE